MVDLIVPAIFGVLLLYLAPTILSALVRPGLFALFCQTAFNVMLGWTIIGWFVALNIANRHMAERTAELNDQRNASNL